MTGIGSTIGTDTYVTDQWKVRAKGAVRVTGQRVSSLGLPGFTYALKVTITTAMGSPGAGDYLLIEQPIEGLRTGKLGFGAAGALAVAVGVWVRSSLTGTFAAYLQNSARDRSLATTFTVSAANTWEYKTLLFAGDTSGTWLSDTGVGLRLGVTLAAGSSLDDLTSGTWAGSEDYTTSAQTNMAATNGATFELTGAFALPLANGATVNPLSSGIAARLLLSYGDEERVCKRYYAKSIDFIDMTFGNASTGRLAIQVYLPGEMRVAPSVTIYDTALTAGKVFKGANGKTGVVQAINVLGFDVYTDDTTSANELAFYYRADARL